MSDAINPDHYKRLPAEAIEIIEAMIAGAPDNKAAYLHGQAAKYDLRLWGKGKSLEDFLSDWGKHIWYALRLESHLLELIEKQKADEQQKAADLQSLKEHPFGKLRQPKWTPKVGDWVKIKKPADTQTSATSWWPSMDKYDGQIIQVKQIEEDGIVLEDWGFMFDWLEPAEQPKATLNSDKIPEGYRKLNDSSEEPRQLGDLRWSVAAKRYVEIGVDEIGYANRDNWAACRKITTEVTGEATGEVKPPDGWRFLEVGEVIREGDLPWEDGWVYATEPIMFGMVLQEHWTPMIRRNKFEVGEKVVHVDDKELIVYVVEGTRGDGAVIFSYKNIKYAFSPDKLAPYIEEAK